MSFDSNFSVRGLVDTWDLNAEIAHTEHDPAYSSKLALFSAVMSQLAYTPFEKSAPKLDWLRASLDQIDFDLISAITLDNALDTQCFIAQKKQAGIAVIAYRGTTGKRDWINNFQVDLQQAAPGIEVHKGFLNLINELAVNPGYVAAMDQIHDNARMIICGHSLGGALANVHTLLNPPGNFSACYTIGAPRIGLIAPDTRNCNRIFRIVNDKDMVPRVPFAFMGYRHCGRLVDCNPRYRDGPKEITNYSDNPITSFLDLLVLAGSLEYELRTKLMRLFIDRDRQSSVSDFGLFDIINLVAREIGSDWDPDLELSEANLRMARRLIKDLVLAQPVSDHDALAYISELR